MKERAQQGEGGFLQPLYGGEPPNNCAKRRAAPEEWASLFSLTLVLRWSIVVGRGWRLPRPLLGVQVARSSLCPCLAPAVCVPPRVYLCVPLLFSQDAQPRWLHPNGLILTYSSRAESPTAGGGVGFHQLRECGDMTQPCTPLPKVSLRVLSALSVPSS